VLAGVQGNPHPGDTVVCAVQIGEPGLIAVGVLAGVFSGVEAARVHDQGEELSGT
jgi:hypothetical protein